MFLEKQKVGQKICENDGDYFLEFRQNQWNVDKIFAKSGDLCTV